MMNLFRMVTGLLAVVVLAFPTQASGGGGGHGSSSGPSNRVRASFTVEPDDLYEGDERTGYDEAGPRGVDIPTLTLPTFIDDELTGYVFVNVRVIVAEGVDPWAVRENAHKIRHALILAGHRHAIAAASDPESMDTEHAREVLLEGLAEIVRPEDVERLEVTSVDAHSS